MSFKLPQTGRTSLIFSEAGGGYTFSVRVPGRHSIDAFEKLGSQALAIKGKVAEAFDNRRLIPLPQNSYKQGLHSGRCGGTKSVGRTDNLSKMSGNQRFRKRDRKPNAVLGDSNILDGSLENPSSDEEVVKRHRLVQRRKSFIELDKKKQRVESGMETPRGEKRKSSGGTSGGEISSEGEKGSDSENRVGRAKRIRRRLSKKVDDGGHSLNMSYGNLNVSTASPTVASPKKPTDKKTLQEIYSTCSALFQAHKITPQNAFSLKLVECLDEIIESDDFDKRNLPLLARTLEIGGKIYVCRVDCTHAHTIKLATEIAANQNEEQENEVEDNEDGQDLQDNNEEAEGRKKVRTRVKKRSRFIEDSEAKLNTRFEDQSSKYASRRTSLKIKLHRNVDEELDFDYVSYFQKPGEKHPIETEEEYLALGSKGCVPDSHVNEDEIKEVPWHPFNALSEWDPSKVDIWGIPLANTDPMDMSNLQRQLPCVADDEEFAYNPENRPDEYPAPEPGDNDIGFPQGNDCFGDDHFDENPPSDERNECNMSKPIAVDNLRSLDDLKRFFLSLKGNQLVLKNKYGWAGPVFLKPQRSDLKKRAADGKSHKKLRKQKSLVLSYGDIDWKDPTNKYIDGDEEDYRNPFDSIEGHDDPMDNIIRFFIDSNRNIFKLMEEEFREGKDVMSQSVLGGRDKVDDYGVEMNIEAPRDFEDDSFGDMLPQPEAEPLIDGVEDLAVAGMNLTAMFPGTLGFDTNDPLSRASEFDSLKFSKQPKPIDMHALKVVIRKILKEKLLVDDEGRPTSDEDRKFDLMALVTEMLRRVDNRMAKHMSMAIIVVGLMHVVAENKFFMVSEPGSENPNIVCRGKTWKHKDHIPMAAHSEDTG
ncbi:unnamed protein product [Allacma fusca]|uniref:Condensin complex subunit 2 n=1 Tax=Allacma fusca TaxID=39272 RepID=A0A8J2PHD2_9HEXA|nr:unnamed protein product [Allacma fusca]